MITKQGIIEKRLELNATNEKIRKIREESRVDDLHYDLTKTKLLEGDEQQRISEMRKLKTKTDSLGAELDEMVAAFEALESEPGQKGSGGINFPAKKDREEQQKSLGQRFVESAEFKQILEAGAKAPNIKFEIPDIELKTLMQTSAGFAPQAVRTGEVEGYSVEPIGLFNYIPKGQTGQSAYVYMEETTRTIAAAEKAETGAYAESAFSYTERSETVRDIGHFVPVTRAQLDDVPQVRTLIDQDMRQGLLERLDYQLINGDGSAPNVRGFLNVSGLQEQSASGMSTLDAIYKAITKIGKNAFVPANVVFVNGEDWEPIQLMKSDGGQYIWGHPADVGPMRVWGRQVIGTFRIAKGTAGVGAFNKMTYAERSGIVVEISDSHSDYFTYNKLAIRAWLRGVFVWKRPAAFCKVTGIGA